MRRRSFIALLAAFFTPLVNAIAAAFGLNRAFGGPPQELGLSTSDKRARRARIIEEYLERSRRFAALPELEKLSITSGIPIERLRELGYKD